MNSLKQKAIKGASWSLTGRLLEHGVQFLFGIFLARLLLPEQYGLVAMAMVFITVLYVFVDSGFSAALIQKKTITNDDLSTVFYLNFGIGLVFYGLLYFAAPFISSFYNEPQLTNIIRVLSLIIILYALTLVQNSIIKRDVNFKLMTRIELVSQIISGFIGIYLANNDFGVWAIIWKTLISQSLTNIQLWVQNNWFPSTVFSKSSFRVLFSFSSKLLLSAFIEKVYSQLHRLIVGKYFPPAELGFYTRAEQFQNLPTSIISSTFMSLLLPVFSKMQDDPIRMKNAAKKVIKIVMFFNVNAMVIMGILAKPIILVLIGEQWLPTVPYLQLLVIVGLFYPVHVVNVQIITSLGRSDLFLRIEVIKKIIGIPSLILGIFVGIKAMIIGIIATSLIALLINTYYTKKLINLGIIEQLRSLYKTFIIAFFMGVTLYSLIFLTEPFFSNLTTFITFPVLAFAIILFLAHMMHIEEYYDIKEIVFDIINKNGNKK